MISRRLCCLISLLFVPAAPALAVDKKQGEGQALIARAAKLSSLESQGSNPFRLRIRWKTMALASGPAEGTYLLVWMDRDQWREEVSLLDFNQVKVGGKGKMWMTRSLAFRPWSASQIGTLLESLWELNSMSDDIITKVFGRSEHGVTKQCVESHPENSPKRVLCFADSGELVSSLYFGSESLCEYSDYAAFGDRSFPRKMRVMQGQTLLIAVQVEELAAESSPNPDLFTPPASATEWPTCWKPTQPKLLTKVHIHYPESAREAHQHGSVIIYVVIDKDGSVHNAKIIQTAGKELDEAALAAVRGWNFSPSTCGATPIPIETEIIVDFTRSR